VTSWQRLLETARSEHDQQTRSVAPASGLVQVLDEAC
jgi:hypothetical protein